MGATHKFIRNLVKILHVLPKYATSLKLVYAFVLYSSEHDRYNFRKTLFGLRGTKNEYQIKKPRHQCFGSFYILSILNVYVTN